MKKFFVPVILIFALVLASCSNTSINTSRLTPNEKIAMVDGIITSIGKTTLQLYQAGKISQAQVKYVYQVLSTAAAMADTAQAQYATNATASDTVIQEINTMLQQLRLYLNSAAGGANGSN